MSGGGAYLSGSGQMTIAGTTVASNKAVGQGGGIFVNSGSLTITNSAVTGSSADAGGGLAVGHGTAAITGSSFSGDTAYDGGAINNNGVMNLTNCTIASNTSYILGGGLIADSGAVTVISKCKFDNDIADGSGGGLENDGTMTIRSSTLLR